MPNDIDDIIPREDLVKEIRVIVTPTAKTRCYPLIIGEHGTGKSSLIKLAVDGLKEPKGVVYVDTPDEDSDVRGTSLEAIVEAINLW